MNPNNESTKNLFIEIKLNLNNKSISNIVPKMKNQKRLTRNIHDRIVGGVCSGMAEYMEIETWLMRLVCVLLLIAALPYMLLLYVMFWIIMPPATPSEQIVTEDLGTVPADVGKEEKTNIFLGLLLIGAGLLFLLHNFVHWFAWEKWWPVLIILLGLGLLFSGKPIQKDSGEKESTDTSISSTEQNVDEDEQNSTKEDITKSNEK